MLSPKECQRSYCYLRVVLGRIFLHLRQQQNHKVIDLRELVLSPKRKGRRRCSELEVAGMKEFTEEFDMNTLEKI